MIRHSPNLRIVLAALLALNGCKPGYVAAVARQLRAQETVTRNLEVRTAAIGRDFESPGQQYNRTAGNFADGERPLVLTDSTVIMIFAGVNDVSTLMAPLGGEAGGADPGRYIDARVRAFGSNYVRLAAGMGSRAPSAHVIGIKVPSVAAIPYFAGRSPAEREAEELLSVGFTPAVNALASQAVSMIDLMCSAQAYASRDYSSDFHLYDSGYAFMAAEMLRAVTTSSYPARMSFVGR